VYISRLLHVFFPLQAYFLQTHGNWELTVLGKLP
jgi:hypothetical protein